MLRKNIYIKSTIIHLIESSNWTKKINPLSEYKIINQ